MSGIATELRPITTNLSGEDKKRYVANMLCFVHFLQLPILKMLSGRFFILKDNGIPDQASFPHRRCNLEMNNGIHPGSSKKANRKETGDIHGKTRDFCT